MNHFELLRKFPNEQAVINHFIKVRYGSKVICHFCGKPNKISVMKNRPKFFQCNFCNKSFSIFKGTIFEKTKVSLLKWMLAVNFVCNNKKSLPALQFQREIGGSYKTSFRMLHQIRKAMDTSRESKRLFEAIVEVDETYIGGKPRKQKNAESLKRGRGTKKTPVVGVLERESGKVYARVAVPNKEGKKLTGKQLLNIINDSVSSKATIISDEFTGYNILNKNSEENKERVHLVIDHSDWYVRDGYIHTNGIEGFWALLKRGIIGSYHKISVKYMQNYINEFTFRYSNRKNENIFDLIIEKSILI